MVRQMVGQEVPLAWCGGNPAGGLGTTVDAIEKALQAAWSDRGVVIMGDRGGAETNSEMASERLPERKRTRVVVCNAPIVKRSVMAATESSASSALEQVLRA